MKTTIRLTLFSVLLLALVSCEKELLEEFDYVGESKDMTMTTKADNTYYYHEPTGLLLMPKTKSRVMPVGTKEYAESNFSAYALKIFPRSYLEQRHIENLEDVIVSYVPFGYTPVSINNMSRETLRRNYTVIEEENPYTETSKCIQYAPDADASSMKTTKIHLPTLYVEWPKEKPLPQNLNYDIIGGLRIPGGGGDLPFLYCYPIVFRTYDSVLNDYVRLNKLKVYVDMGEDNQIMYTNNKGCVTVSNDIVGVTTQPEDYTLTLIMSSPDWTITRDSTSTTPINNYLGKVSSLGTLVMNDTTYVTLSSLTTEYEIHRAVDYYHNTLHDFSSSINTGESQTIYSAVEASSSSINGKTIYNSQTPFLRIIIYNNLNTLRNTMGTIFHEIGHARKNAAGYSAYTLDTEIMLHESYASFIGWYLSRLYYETHGYVFPSEYNKLRFNTEHCQYWIFIFHEPYTPLLIDMCDNYNQHSYNNYFNSYVNDTITGCPITSIEYAGKISSSLAEFLTNISYLEGIYYTQAQLNDILYYYSYFQ